VSGKIRAENRSTQEDDDARQLIREDMSYRILGRTGERVSAIGVGGWHLGLPHVDDGLSARIVHEALDRGINFLDNSWDYNDGASEIRMGQALKNGYRQKAFVITKIDGRSKTEATGQLDEFTPPSGYRLHRPRATPRGDSVRGPASDLRRGRRQRRAHRCASGGETALHWVHRPQDPRIHLHMLDVADQAGFTFDTVQMPLNIMDPHYRSFERLVLPELVKRDIGVLGMKSMANGVILKSGVVTAIECLHYALSLPTSVVITGIDSLERLEQAFHVARTLRPMPEAQRGALLAKTARTASRGEFEPFKTTSIFDATASNPAWLGEEPERVRQLMLE
jgi:aryl-alcohol dehydrogenase-like predicted oxidoreductase